MEVYWIHDYTVDITDRAKKVTVTLIIYRSKKVLKLRNGAWCVLARTILKFRIKPCMTCYQYYFTVCNVNSSFRLLYSFNVIYYIMNPWSSITNICYNFVCSCLMYPLADYEHSETGVTPLMAACSRGLLTPVEQLINLGANVHFRAIQAGCTAIDIAGRFGHEMCLDLLHSYVWVCID